MAAQSLLIDLAAAGSRLVAVGERGHVLFSDDQGKSWTQAGQVPAQVLLTGVCFADAQHGIAVGHDETILTTADAGNTWKLTHYAPQRQQPLLDVWCGEGGRAIAIGAYSSFYESTNNGATWVARKFEALSAQAVGSASSAASGPRVASASGGSQSESAASDSAAYEDIPADYHLNRIVAASESRLYIAAEAGHLYRSDDVGVTWRELTSPYEGSFFGVLPLAGDDVLAYGLRGNLYRSRDAGQSWQRIETKTTAMLNDGVRLPNGEIALVGLSGVVLTSRDGASAFELHQQPDRRALSAVLPDNAQSLIVVGEGGMRLIALAGHARSVASAP